MRLYRKYPEVPDRWYLILFLLMMALSIVVCEAWDTRLPWWGFLVTQLIPFIFTLPIGIVQAITNVQIGVLIVNVGLYQVLMSSLSLWLDTCSLADLLQT